MEHTNLVQILKAPKEEGSSIFAFGGGYRMGGLSQANYDGMNKVFSFHYMGAAEFELGNLPKACDKLIADRSDYVTGSIKVSWRTEDWKTQEEAKGRGEVYYICHKDHEIDVKERISLWALGKNVPLHTTKERVRLNESFAGDRFKGWFELDNSFLFFIDKDMFEGTKEMFGVKSK